MFIKHKVRLIKAVYIPISDYKRAAWNKEIPVDSYARAAYTALTRAKSVVHS